MCSSAARSRPAAASSCTPPTILPPNSTLPIDEKIGLTATLDVLRAIARGRGPRRALMALGYAGWGPGQLETEIQRNGWLHCAADDAIVFDGNLDGKYERAMRKIGIDLTKLSGQAGHA